MSKIAYICVIGISFCGVPMYGMQRSSSCESIRSLDDTISNSSSSSSSSCTDDAPSTATQTIVIQNVQELEAGISTVLNSVNTLNYLLSIEYSQSEHKRVRKDLRYLKIMLEKVDKKL
ncbi:hypothetical protein J120_00060 [candidate division TM6 bacterium JCVI TM6SC1]|uniref:Uncharacterized protein n=1 Tax=candidate division TM6 bacterium JCVI TM6SC1 TaxID=1306947 RepID=A0A0D2JE84_9BACT|nr:hypothetical protein J120_00060 [candidate division TM6 bacterium JCVI TM6SC1]